MGDSQEPKPRRSDEVVVVDDDADVCEAVATLADLGGFRSLTFTDGRAALRHIRAVALPRLLLVDIRMPNIDGWEFMRELGEIPFGRSVPAFLMSAEPRRDDSRAYELGALGVLQKPFDIAALAGIIERHCRGLEG
jgi:CheY-like chemotaxis protein